MDEVKLLPCDGAIVKLARNALRDSVFKTADDNLHMTVESAIYRMQNSAIARYLLRFVAQSRPTIVTDEVVERPSAREFLAVAHENAKKPLVAVDIRTGNIGRQGVMWVETTTALAAIETALAAMPTIPEQGLGDTEQHIEDWARRRQAALVERSNEYVRLGRDLNDPDHRVLLGEHRAYMALRSFIHGSRVASVANGETPTPGMPTIDQDGGWQPIEEMRWPIEQPIIVSDGLSVYGAGWWHPGEQAWLDCGGITPTAWRPLPEPPAQPEVNP